jgi:N-sulfoglucosamine sulfohydrolase
MRHRILFLFTIFVLLYGGVRGYSQEGKSDKPNILWIVAEDMGLDTASYGVKGSYTPNLDMLAKEGILYTRAYTTAAICAPSRSSFMTGVYQHQVNAKFMRPGAPFVKKQLPEGVNVFTKYIGLCGRPKKDWGFENPRLKPYDETDWKTISSKQPFFCQYQFYETHPPFHPCPEHPVDVSKIKIDPDTPDTPTVRKERGLYLEYLTVLDTKVGELIRDLKTRGLYENTIIVFSGDNGPALFLGKTHLHERGIKMPLIVRTPPKHDWGVKPGTVNNELVSALDFAPTFIEVAGGIAPKYLEGRVLIGPKKGTEPDFLYALWDNLDIVTDRVRSVVSRKSKYIRNYTDGITFYEQGHRNVEAVKEAKQLHDQGRLPSQFGFYFRPKPAEELYDLETDPFELNNLAGDASKKTELDRMRKELDLWIARTGDSDKLEDPKMIKEMLRLREQERKEEIETKGRKGKANSDE